MNHFIKLVDWLVDHRESFTTLSTIVAWAALIGWLVS